MTAKLVPVKPIISEGIEMYCSTDGRHQGMTTRGLVRFTGIARTTLQRLLLAIAGGAQMKGEANHIEVPECLLRLDSSKLYISGIKSRNGSGKGFQTGSEEGNIISSQFCAAICLWAAFDYNGGSSLARHSSAKFIEMGMSGFIKQATGFEEPMDNNTTQLILESLSTLSKQVAELAEVRVELSTTNGYRKLRVDYDGLEEWCQSLEVEQSEQNLLSPEQELFSINEAVAEQFDGLVLTKNLKHSLALRMGQTISGLRSDVRRTKIVVNGRGYSMKVRAYTRQELPLIRLNLLNVMNNV